MRRIANQWSKATVSDMVRAVAKTFRGSFHTSDMHQAVSRHMPDASKSTVRTSLWNLVHRDGYLETLGRSLYRVRQ